MNGAPSQLIADLYEIRHCSRGKYYETVLLHLARATGNTLLALSTRNDFLVRLRAGVGPDQLSTPMSVCE